MTRRVKSDVGKSLVCRDQESLLRLDLGPDLRILPPAHTLLADARSVVGPGSQQRGDTFGQVLIDLDEHLLDRLP
jgi:hypothetical protein